MAVSYKKLFHLLIEKNMTNAESRNDEYKYAQIATQEDFDKF